MIQRRRMRVTIIAVFVSLILCASRIANGSEPYIQYRVLAAGDAGTGLKLKAGHKWLADKADLDLLIKKYFPESVLETLGVDFSSGKLLFINSGEYPSGPHDIGVLNVFGLGNIGVVSYTVLHPGCITTASFTHTYKLIYIESKINKFEVASVESSRKCDK